MYAGEYYADGDDWYPGTDDDDFLPDSVTRVTSEDQQEYYEEKYAGDGITTDDWDSWLDDDPVETDDPYDMRGWS